MRIDKTLSAYQLVPLVFMQDGCAAGQNNVQLPIVEAAGPVAIGITGYTMPFAGEIIGVSYDLETAATTGTLTIGPTIDGTEASDPTLTVTTGTGSSDKTRRGVAPFAAGAVIGAEITTSAGWDGTNDLSVVVWVILYLSGI